MTETNFRTDSSPARSGRTAVQVDAHAFAVEITARTPIRAAAEDVWRILADTAAYPGWNPFVRRIEGRLAMGERLTVTLRPAQKDQVLTPRVVDLQPGRSFTWLGRVEVPGLLDGRHHFAVEPAGDRSQCVLVQQERLSGLLVPAFRAMLTRDAPAAFAALNDALAVRAEGRR